MIGGAMTYQRKPDTRRDQSSWEPEPLHVPAPLPAPGMADDERRESPVSPQRPASRVVVIDLA